MTQAPRDPAWGGNGGGGTATIPPDAIAGDLYVYGDAFLRSGSSWVDVLARLGAGTSYFDVKDYAAPGEDFANLTDNTATLNATITAALAGGGGRILLPRQLRLDGLVTALAGNADKRIHLLGHGIQGTTISVNSTTGHVFDLSNSSFFEISDATITCKAKKVSGSLFHSDQFSGGVCQQNDFRRLWILSAYRAFDWQSCGTQTAEGIQFGDSFGSNNTWAGNAFFILNGAISCRAKGIRGGTAWGLASGVCNIGGATDSFHSQDWDLYAQPGTGATTMLGLVINAGTWSKFDQVSIESGALDYALTVNGGTRSELHGCHLLGRNVIGGGTGTKIFGGECLLSDIHGLQLAGGTDTEIVGVDVHDVGAGYNCIDVSNGVNDFTIALNQLGRQGFGGGQPASLIRVGSSANAQDRYIIRANRGRNYTGTALVDNGTGANKDIGGNVFVA